MQKQYTYDDLADDVKQRVEDTQKAVDLIDQGIALLLKRSNYVYEQERDTLMEGRYAAGCIADRAASIALQPLRNIRRSE